MEIGEYFRILLLVWSSNFWGKKKTPDFFRTKFIWVGAGSGLGFGFGLGLVSKVVILAFFDISLVITLEPHVGHTKFPDFHTLS